MIVVFVVCFLLAGDEPDLFAWLHQPYQAEIGINVFSGRLNPSWAVPIEPLGQFDPVTYAHLPVQPGNPARFLHSGYRGFSIAFRNRLNQTVAIAYVYDGLIDYSYLDVHQIWRTLHYQDVIGLEAFLRQEATERGLESYLYL